MPELKSWCRAEGSNGWRTYRSSSAAYSCRPRPSREAPSCRRTDLPEDLAELPGFTFTVPVDDPQEALAKVFVKGMMHVVASLLKSLSQSRGDRITFVALARFDSKPDSLAFSFWAPLTEVRQISRNGKIDGPQVSQAVADLSVEYRFAMPSGLMMPLVFDYNHGNKHLLVTNRNQIENPKQFLDPDTWKTTSGFLNFLGALLILGHQETDVEYAQKVLSYGNSLIDDELDEWLRWLYRFMDENVLFTPAYILVDPKSPETYYYQYEAP